MQRVYSGCPAIFAVEFLFDLSPGLASAHDDAGEATRALSSSIPVRAAWQKTALRRFLAATFIPGFRSGPQHDRAPRGTQAISPASKLLTQVQRQISSDKSFQSLRRQAA